MFHDLAARRPAAVLEGVAHKFKSASGHSGWVQDSAANYDFGRFGSGLEAARAALARRMAAGGALRVLDAGCGSGGQLMDLASLVEVAGGAAYLRGVTAEVNAVPPRLAGRVVRLAASGASGPAAGATCAGSAGVRSTITEAAGGEAMQEEAEGSVVDMRIYQDFPLEGLATTAADFVQQGMVFDLILCSWTLFHLCDPLGTVLQLRALLDPDGAILANGAYFYVEDTPYEAGSIAAMEHFFGMLSPEVEFETIGSPMLWITEDPDDEWAAGAVRRWTQGRSHATLRVRSLTRCGTLHRACNMQWRRIP